MVAFGRGVAFQTGTCHRFTYAHSVFLVNGDFSLVLHPVAHQGGLRSECDHKAWLEERGVKPIKLRWSTKDLVGCILLCIALTLGTMWPMLSG